MQISLTFAHGLLGTNKVPVPKESYTGRIAAIGVTCPSLNVDYVTLQDARMLGA